MAEQHPAPVTGPSATALVEKKPSELDQRPTLWIFPAMALGVSLPYFLPGINYAVNYFSVGTVNVPLAVGAATLVLLVGWLRFRMRQREIEKYRLPTPVSS